jgi:hypothetical protein
VRLERSCGSASMHPVEAAKVQKRCDARACYCKMVGGPSLQDLACSPLSGHLPPFSFVQWIPIPAIGAPFLAERETVEHPILGRHEMYLLLLNRA